ncbi:P2X purinoceptor 7-like [Acropora palmata]|uniref:P2X purinoceptor 7-like n=1 Tax=Acropora palmata TaxID=6131 RepID=UPI003DA159AF
MGCITDHEEFSVVCLTRAVFRTAIVGFHYLNRSPVPSPMQNRNYRYAAYRQYVWWIYKRLGRKKRKVIPSCVVSAIRKEFPEADGNYTGFRDPSINEIDLAFL